MRKREVWGRGRVGETGPGWAIHQHSRLLIPMGKPRLTVSHNVSVASRCLRPGLAKLSKVVAGVHCPLLSHHPCSRGERLAGPDEVCSLSMGPQRPPPPLVFKQPPSSDPGNGGWGGGQPLQSQLKKRPPGAQALLLPASPTPCSPGQPLSPLPSTSCRPRPTLSKSLFFQKHELSKTASPP